MVKNKKIKIQLVSFIVLFVIIITLMNSLYIHFIISETLQQKEELEFQRFIQNNSLDYLFLGSSHVHRAIKAELIPNSFNYGFNSNIAPEVYYKFKKIIEKDKVTPKFIFINVDMGHWGINRENSPVNNEFWFYTNFIPLNEYSKLTKKSEISIYLQSKFPIISKGETIIGFIKNRLTKNIEIRKDKLGWLKETVDFSQNSDKQKWIEYSFNVANYIYSDKDIDSTAIEYYTKTLKLAQKNNVTVILYHSPYTKELLDYQNERNVSKEFYFNKINNITTEVLGEEYYFFDYTYLFINNSEYFSDPSHINYIGAENLTKVIYKDINKINLNN